jgi:glycerol-3-phosphate acyltransferase PlsX
MKQDDSLLLNAAQEWLKKFESALAKSATGEVQALFSEDCHWRDVLALNWEIITHSGLSSVTQALISTAPLHNAHHFMVNEQRMPVKWVKRTNVETIEVFFDFQTKVGPCEGILRLVAQAGTTELKAWTLMTSLVEIKGHEEIREAAGMLRAMNASQFNYIGFVEGDGIGKGAADVIVSEGFCGNIALKTAEGTARQMFALLREAMSSSWLARIGYLLARGAFQKLRDKLDPNKSNGSILLGLKGVVVKSHGGVNAEGFAYAVDVGYEMAHYDLLTKINQMLNRDGSALVQAQTAQEAVS